MSEGTTDPAAPEGTPDREPSEATQLSVLPTPQPARTGVPAADAALDRLSDLASGEPDAAAHVEVFEDVHARLQEALGSTDSD